MPDGKKIWLDDIREPPIFEPWTGETARWDAICRTAADCIRLLKTRTVSFVDFDHDLGGGQTGYDVACFIEEQAIRDPKFPPVGWAIHSGNPVGASNIDRAMKSAWRYWNQRTRP